MQIYFKEKKLQKACESKRLSDKRWGSDNAKKIRQRLLELKAADTLADVSKLPPARCHDLFGDRRGQFAVDVKQPYRLVFEPADNPVPLRPDGSIDKSSVRSIQILEVENYHG